MRMHNRLSLAYSPCPNDTYIFAALTHGLLQDAPPVDVTLLDIDELNAAAQTASFDLIKVSFGAIPYLMNNYRILRAGGALGRGCGPLLVARPGKFGSLEDVRNARIAIPGERTTAYLLLQLALGLTPATTVVRFDQIVDAVARGRVDAGLIIHESRFTYASDDLVQVEDLGAWWERTTGNPIPLGAILVRNGLLDAPRIDRVVRQSLAFARQHEETIMPYVRKHAFEMSETVMREHIHLYVNEYSDDISDVGINAVRDLFERARNVGLLPKTIPTFVEQR